MIDFTYNVPTKVFFGKDKENQIGSILNDYNIKKVLVVTGKGSVEKSGLLRRVLEKIEENGIDFKVYRGVRANPTIQSCRECLEIAKDFKPDLLLPIGGGSVIDCSKNVAVGYYYDGDSFDFNLHKSQPKKALPIGVILTISAAGSEMSNSCVIQDDETGKKSGFNCDLVRPLFAIENPELTYTVPKVQTAYGIVDILMHTLERYLCKSNGVEPADDFALSVLKNVVAVAEKAYKNPTDYESRAVLMLMSSFSHNDVTSMAKDKRMPVHALEHTISGAYPFVAHAAGLALIYPKWARYYLKYDVDKFDRLGKVVFNLNDENKQKNAENAINSLEKLFSEMEMPMKFKDLGIENPDIERLINLLTNNGTTSVYHHCEPLDKNVARIIFEQCR